MSSLAELPELAGFFSYSREDDEAFKGTLSALRDGIQRELSAQLGRSKRTFRLWQDQTAIAPGKLWESEIKTAIDESFFFIPIVTPRSVSSKYCKFEFERFSLAKKQSVEATSFFQFFTFRLLRSRTRPNGAMISFSRQSDAVSMSIGVPCVISIFRRPPSSRSSASVKRSSKR